MLVSDIVRLFVVNKVLYFSKFLLCLEVSFVILEYDIYALYFILYLWHMIGENQGLWKYGESIWKKKYM